MSTQEPDTAIGDYFVSARDAGQTWLLLGPFALHATALAFVEKVRTLAVDRDPLTHFYSFGTLRLVENSGKTGSANKYFPEAFEK